jgi:sterol desaturase/sphingolipid hydroxylase (fatty acid hydroxylase superfamily)
LSIDFIEYIEKDFTFAEKNMQENTWLVAFIVPAFLLFVGLEYWIAKRKGKENLFNYASSVSNISIGIAERLLNLFITGSFYALYVYLHKHFALFSIPNHWSIWLLLLLATDFVWYWYHRLGHEINLLWGAHIVHHQSEEFNYTVSARITTIQAVVRNLFWCVLPIVGFDPLMVISILVVHGAYSFFTHTQVIGKLGWIEKIFITPSHHGVHHASNDKYLNKNYGDIFVFWDKLFGTFQKEEEKPVYGLTHPLKSHSFLWQHFHYYFELAEACRRSGSLVQSLKIIFGKPEQLDQHIRADIEKALLAEKRSFHMTSRFRWYITLQVIVALGGLFFFTLYFYEWTLAEKWLGASLLLITLVNCGALLEQQQWVYAVEVVRVLLVCSLIAFEQQSFGFLGVSLLVVLMIATLDSVEETYYRWLYKHE